MMPLSMKTYLALLWGISVVYAVGSDVNKTTGSNSITEPHKPAEISVISPAEPTVETKEAIGTDRTEPQRLHAPAAVNTTAGAAHPSHNATANPREDQRHQQSSTTSTYMTTPATASLAAVPASSRRPSSTTKSEVTSTLPPITSFENVHAPAFNQTPGVPSATPTTTVTASPTSQAEAFDPTKSETFSTRAPLVSTLKMVTKTSTATSQFPGTAGLNSSAESSTIFSTESPISTTKVSTTDVSTSKVSTTKVSTSNVTTTDISTITNSSTTNVSTTEVSTTDISTSPLGILIPREHNKSPVPTTKSTPLTTTAPRDVSKSPAGTEVQPCSTRRAAKRCLIAIASLAALATGFMVSTIVLCTKLSKRKYKVNKPQPATEMMCISALLPERNVTYSRQRNPVTNGVLVIHDDIDSDEDGGDNLTLTSFLPENDRFV